MVGKLKKDHREPLDDPFSFAHRKQPFGVTEPLLEAGWWRPAVMTVATRTVAGSTVLLHHLISLRFLFWCQQAIKLRVHAQVINHFVSLQLRLLVSQSAHYRFVELTIGSRGVDLFANIVQFRVTLLFDSALRFERCLHLFLLSISQA